MNFQPKIDLKILIPAFFLYALGITTIYSVAPSLINQTLLFGFLGLLFYLLFSGLDYQIYKSLSNWFYIMSIIFLGLTEVVGVVTRGSVRWLDIGFIRLQPSELIKPLMVIFLATNFEKISSLKKILGPSVFYFLPLLFILRQPDLGNAMVFAFVWLVILFVSGVKPSVLVAMFAGAPAAILVVWHFLKNYQKQRIFTFINPGSDPLRTGYNAIQSTLAVGAGQVLGRGLGRGTQSHLLFLPEYHTDFIFASFAEEWGFLGVCLLLGVYFFLLYHLFSKSQSGQERFGQLILLGVFAIIFIQMFVNMGMNMGMVPITGITLPLVSYGGSSIISTAILLGIASNITKQKPKESTFVIS